MRFDVYKSFKNKAGVVCPGIKPQSMEWSDVVNITKNEAIVKIIDEIRATEDKDKQAQLKKLLPCVTFMGRTETTRKASQMQPTQLVMIDIDHCKDARGAWAAIMEKSKEMDFSIVDLVMVAHVTPRLGLRIVFAAQKEFTSIEDNVKWFSELFSLSEYGDVDAACKDFSRLSFLPKYDDILFESAHLYVGNTPIGSVAYLKNGMLEIEQQAELDFGEDVNKVKKFTAEEKEEFEAVEYRGTPLRVIIEKYVEFFGEPSRGERHNYYNEMVKNFRCITDNNQRLLLYILPSFGHTLEERRSQIASICRVNTLSSLPKNFYFFLKDHGFYQPRQNANDKVREYMMSEEVENTSLPPYLPPVFRELVGLAPKDFVLPSINALLPILGTLTSYVQARYPYDDRLHTTSFFSVIYAPPSTGKGFCERFMDLLFEDLKIRDFIQSERENIYLRAIARKGANEKAPALPHTSMRLIPAKNSEAEFLQKQKDNCGYHMFTYAAEMDSWAKGAKAAGGNKDDMIRIAWDNGEYGQQFKSANTFKGTVRLYWNVLISGTVQQLENYFRNVENGLVTRCSFTSIDNQEFAAPSKWRQLKERDREKIRKFTKRCDANSYEEPCTISIADLEFVEESEFDKKVPWRFKFKERKTVDLSWIMPTIDEFEREQMEKAALDVDRARDVFRRRVGVRGFRLALICSCLWEKPRKRDLEKCKLFVKWWMENDIESMLKLWGEKYNELNEFVPKLSQRSVFNELPKEFTKGDVYVQCRKQGIKTPIRRIIFDWKKLKAVEQKDKDTFVKMV